MNTLEQLQSGALAGAQRLKLACGLTAFPREIFELADTLEILDLSGNALSSLPEDLPRLGQLRILFCSDNQFTELPEVLGRCPQLVMVGFKANRIRTVPAASLPAGLRWLILTDNQIEALPPEIGDCAQLQKLMLAGNRLVRLPDTLARCARLELLRVAANRLTALPAWLPTLPRLAWLAYAGNPLCAAQEALTWSEAPIADIPWDALRVLHRLGEGASGVIHQAEWRIDGAAQPVAVKLFKGAVTSDGLPGSEMAACVRAGAHPNLIPLRGKVAQHPQGAMGLVMALVPPAFTSLAGPPSLASCTRDIYAADTRFALPTAVRMALRVASAAGHLHRRGVLHGDLYGHNILHDGQGQVLLGDFGAASVDAASDPRLNQALQRVEVRAFGCLLEELLERSDAPGAWPAAMATLAALQAACLSEDVGSRPLFDEIEHCLESARRQIEAELVSSRANG